MLPLLIFFTACDTLDDPGEENDHLDTQRVTIETRGEIGALLAEWSGDDGWTDEDGNSIDTLPNPVDTGEGQEARLEELHAGGTHASLTVTFFNPDGSEVEMSTLDRNDETGERECSEYSARYYPIEAHEDTDVIAWPNITHPEGDTGYAQFAERGDGELVGIFHCDHIHFYPENAGEVDVEFHLWHSGHSDDQTDPLTIVVEEDNNNE